MSGETMYVVHWPGNDTIACVKHAKQLVNLGAVMGFSVSTTPFINENLECKNCKNEEGKDGRSKSGLQGNT